MISIRCTQYIMSPYINPYKYKPEIQIKIFRRRRGKFLNRKCIFPTITRSKNCSKYLTKEKGEEDKLNARRKAPHPLPLGWWGGVEEEGRRGRIRRGELDESEVTQAVFFS